MINQSGVVDAHFHLMDPEANPYPWLDPAAKRPNVFGGRDDKLGHVFLGEDYRTLAEPIGIVKAVHIQANWDPTDPVAETAWLHESAERTGFPNALVAFANLASQDVEKTLADHASYPLTRGIRQILNWHPDQSLCITDRVDYMWSDDWQRGFALLEKYELSFDLQIYPHQIPAAVDLAQRFPNTEIVLNHAGMPFFRDPSALEQWRENMGRLAACENATVKVSGPGYGEPDWTVASIRPIVLGTIEAFGPERTMFGSDFPVSGLFSSFADLWSAFDELTSGFSADERLAMFKTNAERIYRL